MTRMVNVVINNCTPHCFMCQIPITEINCSVIIMPIVIGIKSPIRFIEGINNNGNANKISMMAVTLMMLIIFGRCICAILICSNCFYWIEL